MLRASAAVAAGRIHRCTLINGALRKLVGSVPLPGEANDNVSGPGCKPKSRTFCDKHSVFIVKENHTFDNYFGMFTGANGVTSGMTLGGQVVRLHHMPDSYQGKLCNSWGCALEATDAGKMGAKI
jgi:phospholipase C